MAPGILNFIKAIYRQTRKQAPQMRGPSFVFLEISASVRQVHVNDPRHLHPLRQSQGAHTQRLQL